MSGRRLLRLGKKVLVWRVVPYPVRGREECFVVDWPSFWNENLSVEVGVVAIRKRSGRWKVVELELPKGVPEEDAEDIVLSHWYVFDRYDRRRKCRFFAILESQVSFRRHTSVGFLSLLVVDLLYFCKILRNGGQ